MNQSLNGLKVLITRPAHTAANDIQLIENHQGRAVSIPMIDTRYRKSKEEASILSKLSTYSWIVVTSQNAAYYLISILEKHNLLDRLENIQIAAVGKRTAELLEAKGIDIHFIPTAFRAVQFVKEFPFELAAGKSVLFPQGNLARNVIVHAFEESEIVCDRWVLYETIKPRDSEKSLIEAFNSNSFDVVTFASPSAVRHFIEMINQTADLYQRVLNGEWIIASIGPTTSQELRAAGLPVHIEPAMYTMSAMIEEIARFTKDHK